MYEVAGLFDEMQEAQRVERSANARLLIAAGRLCQVRIAESGEERERWCVDGWEAVAAEVGAELGISRGRASSKMHLGLTLLERLPKLAKVCLAGGVDSRVLGAIEFRTGLITDRQVLSRIDEALSRQAPQWNELSREKVTALIDWMVLDLDPEALRIARQSDLDRHVEVRPSKDGMAEIWGVVRGPDGAVFDKTLAELAGSVCPNDTRTTRQRRADALLALATGAPAMACTCESADCAAAGNAEGGSGQVVLHVIAEESTVSGNGAKPGYLRGFGAIPAATVAELAKQARIRPLLTPRDLPPEPHYRPSAALADFIRCRDLTCRFPGCDEPAEHADIDHTVPHPFGPTHASNLKCLCRIHHLLKTFYTGPTGWRDFQDPDGTITWTAANGRTYTTKPGGSLFFPQLATPTGDLKLTIPAMASNPMRGLAMPLRRRTRAADRAGRIEWERGVNRARIDGDPPPF